MPFDRFMELSLYDRDDGYFAAGEVRSEKDGDFLTSPEVSPLFGETLARFVVAERERIGEPFSVVEVAAGTGSLLRPLLDALTDPVAAVAVEVSASSRLRLGEAVPEAVVVGTFDAVPDPLRGVVIANELLDNLPAAVAVRRGGRWMERAVIAEDEELGYVEVEARAEVASWADLHAGSVPDDAVVEVQLAAGAWLREVLSRLTSGAVVVVDYGDTTDGLATRRDEGTVRTYRGHHLGPDPLLEPGATDITMDVDFSALMRVAVDAGVEVRLHRQVEFLTDWGFREALAELRVAELDAARRGDAMHRAVLRSRVVDAEALLHPRGLGDFRVLELQVPPAVNGGIK
ncbi:MAG TPA: SAM-dependent methyltransferase [Acidimicrobiia bacterium]|nr:SAM-dependent methyltransferase [Acidimicrobiia bacterium]